MKPSKTRLLWIVASLLLVGAAGYWFTLADGSKERPIRIGVLHAFSGTMALNEAPLAEMVKLAIDEINAEGGVLGRPVQILLRDTQSDPERAAKLAATLIDDENVSALFGCWTSSCRKAVKSVVESRSHVLFYPLQYEGLEQSPNIAYIGAAPNQQIIPAGVWTTKNLGKKIYLVGSDYVFPRVANLLLNDVIKMNHASVVGEHYFPLGESDVGNIVQDIRDSGATAIINTINGDTNAAFFKALTTSDIAEIPVMSLSVSEPELTAMPEACRPSHFSAWNYFQTLDNSENARFVHRVRSVLGEDVRIGDPMESAYVGVLLWAQAVDRAGDAKPSDMIHALKRLSLYAPQGTVVVDPATQHLWKVARIGRSTRDCRFEQVWASSSPIRPQPFPSYRSREDWLDTLSRLMEGDDG